VRGFLEDVIYAQKFFAKIVKSIHQTDLEYFAMTVLSILRKNTTDFHSLTHSHSHSLSHSLSLSLSLSFLVFCFFLFFSFYFFSLLTFQSVDKNFPLTTFLISFTYQKVVFHLWKKLHFFVIFLHFYITIHNPHSANPHLTRQRKYPKIFQKLDFFIWNDYNYL
jgi:hypothetical protein